VLDRLVYTDPVHGKVLITDAQTIKERAATHFQQYALPLTAPPPMNERWSEQFAPKSFIDPKWYQALMVPPTWDEWIVNLQSLPNDKASEPFKLHNEFYKHACISVKKLTWKLAKMCFQQSVIPDEWKQAYIYPIPKPTEWQCDITKTHPLTLLDTMRKAVMKIMTNRLSCIIAKHNILQGNNFAGLPGGSMETPIKIMNMILEDAKEHNKPVWILLQDLSKAYDRVDLSILRKAMERIKLPAPDINFIIDFFTHRKNAVLTKGGLSDYYDVKIGIDQGEVISLLLWCIYFDPLLCEIAQLNKGYSLHHKWMSDISKSTIQQLHAQIAALGFMDDAN